MENRKNSQYKRKIFFKKEQRTDGENKINSNI